MRGEEAFLQDMLDSARRIQRQIAGGAAKKISPTTRNSFPQLPFDDIARMRDVLAHVYWRINYRIVWDTAITDVPVLIAHLNARLGGGGPTPGGAPP